MQQFLMENLDKSSKIALIGIGNEDRHDDFVGSFVIQQLLERELARDNLFVIDAGSAPTNYIVDLSEWDPDVIVMVDAVDAQELPGSLIKVQKDQLHSQSLDSHSNAKVMLLDFLIAYKPSLKVVIVGIQAKDISLERGLSPEIKESALWLVEKLWSLLH
jgi:hydrogenase maturation protease